MLWIRKIGSCTHWHLIQHFRQYLRPILTLVLVLKQPNLETESWQLATNKDKITRMLYIHLLCNLLKAHWSHIHQQKGSIGKRKILNHHRSTPFLALNKTAANRQAQRLQGQEDLKNYEWGTKKQIIMMLKCCIFPHLWPQYNCFQSWHVEFCYILFNQPGCYFCFPCLKLFWYEGTVLL